MTPWFSISKNSERKESPMEVKDLIREFVKLLVDHPEDVEVREVSGVHTCLFELKVNKADVGKVVGRKGSHAQALRTLLSALGGKQNKKYTLEILEG
jgi:predicted RNA-binding protein YlqC (UPF0109 family)